MMLAQVCYNVIDVLEESHIVDQVTILHIASEEEQKIGLRKWYLHEVQHTRKVRNGNNSNILCNL